MPEGTLELLGSQTPTHLLVPPDVDYSDVVAVREIADMVGVDLDPYQDEFLTHGLGRRRTPDGGSKWATYENAIELSRQNGKSVIFELRALVGLYVFREDLVVYSAHKGETAMQAYTRMVEYIESSPDLKRELWKTPSANGKEAILLKPRPGRKTGQMIKFRTRTPGGGRGLTGDCVIIDEVQDATDDHIAALFPSLAARSITGDPQIWYGGSAGKRSSTVLGRLVKRTNAELQRREAGEEPRERRLLMARFAADLDVDDPADPQVIARVNPALGRRISLDYVMQEYVAMGAALDVTRFAAERLGVGDYPRDEGEDWAIPRRRWEAGEDRQSKMVGPVTFSVEVRMDRSSTAIVAAGWRADGHKHVEAIAEEVGVAWAVTELKRLTQAHDNLGVVIDPGGPAGSLIGPLRDAGVPLVMLKVADVTAAWGNFYDAFAAEDPTIHHTGGLVLTSAAAAAETRPVQGSTTWKRTTTESSSAIIAATWAAHGLDIAKPTQAAGVSRRANRTGDGASGPGQQPRHFRTRKPGGFDPRTSSF
ncbi:hypothetical protein N8K70_03885 [Microbacterium betulae]|uniref:Terminase n=1 Tax=Microbacterium betulae TaxID=2981139 RepID=A0AA97FII3_9MICO|nr:hypothetical protein [Microbacterium sp. AB]WOF23831.1 hypothetical protein N8K70_03885 [Microbacterium sp. AB]